MNFYKAKISEYYRIITGIALLLLYLAGTGLSIYNTSFISKNSHHHPKDVHCNKNYCTCSHENGKCTCSISNTKESGELKFKKCPSPLSDDYTSSTISYFLTETVADFISSLPSHTTALQKFDISSQYISDPPLHPPRLV
jgi:hypothetical protein